jgi:hypothetical protein
MSFGMTTGFASSTHPAGCAVSAVVPLSITAVGLIHVLAITMRPRAAGETVHIVQSRALIKDDATYLKSKLFQPGIRRESK